MWLPAPQLALAGAVGDPSGRGAPARIRPDRIFRRGAARGSRAAATEPTADTIERARAGDPDAFAVIFGAYGDDVLRVCRRLLGDPDSASDARSDVFLKVRSSLASYDAKRPLRGWLRSVASHHCIDRLRREALERRIFAETVVDAGELGGQSPSPLSRVLARENRAALDRALDALPLEYRLPLLMRYFAESTYDEIAEALGTTRGRVGTLIFRGKQRLRAHMAAESGREGGDR